MQYGGALGDHIGAEGGLNEAAICDVVDYAWNVSRNWRMRG